MVNQIFLVIGGEGIDIDIDSVLESKETLRLTPGTHSFIHFELIPCPCARGSFWE
jgi:hypothetical protein